MSEPNGRQRFSRQFGIEGTPIATDVISSPLWSISPSVFIFCARHAIKKTKVQSPKLPMPPGFGCARPVVPKPIHFTLYKHAAECNGIAGVSRSGGSDQGGQWGRVPDIIGHKCCKSRDQKDGSSSALCCSFSVSA